MSDRINHRNALLAEQDTIWLALERDFVHEEDWLEARDAAYKALDVILVRHAEAETALRKIAEHPVISEGEFPDDNCDWHCAAEMRNIASSVLASKASSTPPEGPKR